MRTSNPTRPEPRAVQHTENRHGIFSEAVGDDVWCSADDQLTRAADTAGPTHSRMFGEGFRLRSNFIVDAVGGSRVVGCDVGHQLGQVGASPRMPLDPHAFAGLATIWSMIALVSSMTSS